MDKLLLLFYSFFLSTYWIIGQILFIVFYILIIRKYKVSGQKTALFGLILLFITMISSIFGLDKIAGKIAEYVWIVFAIAFVQEFIHFLRHENK